MAKPITNSSFFLLLLFFTTFLSSFIMSQTQQQRQQPLLDVSEQEAVYEVLSSINSDVPWRTLFPDDLCLSAPHGVVCDYFFTDNTTAETQPEAHISELSFGFVSDHTPNTPCSPSATLSPLLFSSFKYLRKLFFYRCFTGQTPVLVPHISSLYSGFGANLEEIVFIENPALVGPLDGVIGNFTSLRRVVLSGNGFYGGVPDRIGDLVTVEEVTLSRNQLSGGVSAGLSKLKKLRVLDLSQNHSDGNVPQSLGDLGRLLKLDLSKNGLFGKIPESLVKLQRLEFLDLSFNRFGNFGVPVFLGEMPGLREVHLSGNLLGGTIPEIWEKLGGISGIGLSNMGLIGNIPASMAANLRNLCYLGLGNNRLEGGVPEELGFLDFVNEINLENNNLSGRVPFSANFSAKIGAKLKLKGNSGLCVDQELGGGGSGGGGGGGGSSPRMSKGSWGQLKLCNNSHIHNSVLFKEEASISSSPPAKMLSHSPEFLMVLGFLFLSACALMVC